MKGKIFEEVEKGYTPQEAVAEAFRCIKCQDAPCNKGVYSQIGRHRRTLQLKGGKKREGDR